MQIAIVLLCVIGLVSGGLAAWFFLKWEKAMRERDEAVKRADQAEQRILAEQAFRQEWEKQQAALMQSSTEATKKAVLETIPLVSNKLIEDHKRESLEARKASEEATQKTTEKLQREFQVITETVASLRDARAEDAKKIGTLMQALAAPASAGQLAEVGLENSLKNLSLQPRKDFIMQYAITGGEGAGLRPDAVIFLPHNQLMVIDCKASKFALQYAEAIGAAEEAAALTRLAQSMNTHLNDLRRKDYEKAILDMYRAGGREGQAAHIWMVMYVPHDSVIEAVQKADPEFSFKLSKSNIYMVGPVSLQGLLSIAQIQIRNEKQEENQEKILAGVQDLMDSVIQVIAHVGAVGRGIKSSGEHLGKVVNSVNSRLLPRIKRLAEYGVKPKSKEIPPLLPSYDVIVREEVAEESDESEKLRLVSQ